MSRDDATRAFGEEWPRIAERLKSALMRKHLPPWFVEDVVQETGLRLIKVWDRVDPSRSAPGLAITIANNLLWEHSRRKDRCELPGLVPDVVDGNNVESAGLARAELGRVKRVLPQLSPAHRSVLLAEIGEAAPPSAPSRDAVKMLRIRARRNLSALLDKASAFGATVIFEARQLASRPLQHLGYSRATGEAQAIAAVAAVATTVILVIPHPADLLVPAPPWKTYGHPDPTLLTVEIARQRGDLQTLRRKALGARGTEPKRRPSRPTREHHDKDDDARHYRLSAGDEGSPAEGEATVGLIPQNNRGESRPASLPRCSPSATSGHEIEWSCEAEVLDRKARAKLRARSRH